MPRNRTIEKYGTTTATGGRNRSESAQFNTFARRRRDTLSLVIGYVIANAMHNARNVDVPQAMMLFVRRTTKSRWNSTLWNASSVGCAGTSVGTGPNSSPRLLSAVATSQYSGKKYTVPTTA